MYLSSFRYVKKVNVNLIGSFLLFLHFFSFPFHRISTSYIFYPLILYVIYLIFKVKSFPIKIDFLLFIYPIYSLCNFLIKDAFNANCTLNYFYYFLPIILLFFISIFRLKHIHFKFQFILYGFILGIVVFNLIAIVIAIKNYIYTQDLKYFVYNDFLSFSTQSPLYISLYSLTGIIFTLYLLHYNFFKNKLVGYFFIIILIISIFFSFSRMVILLFCILSTIFFIYKFISKDKDILKIFILFVFLFVSLVCFLDSGYFIQYRFRNYLPYREMTEYNKPEARFYIWKSSLTVSKNEHYKGLGACQKQAKLKEEYLNNNFQEGYFQNFNAHSQYIEILLKEGLLGLILYLSFLFYLLYLSIKQKSTLGIIILIVFSIFTITESFLETQQGIFYLYFLIPFLIFFQNQKKIDENLYNRN